MSRRYIDYPSRATRADGAAAAATDGGGGGSSVCYTPLSTASRRLRRGVRTFVCAVLYGAPFGIAAPNSPLLSMCITPHNKRMIVPRMMTHFFCVNTFAAGIGYCALVEPRLRAPRAVRERRWLPQLGPLTALVPGGCCLVVSHFFYPGICALLYEPTLASRGATFVRLSVKCLFAYAPVHVPAVVLYSGIVGSLLWLFKTRSAKDSEPQGHVTTDVAVAA